MKSAMALALLFALAAPQGAAAQQPTVQQQFDAAEAAHNARNPAEALRLLDALEPRVRNNPRTFALVRIRRAAILSELGRLEEAAADLRPGLAALPADDATLHADRFQGLLTLALIDEHELDYPEALRLYRLAGALPVTDADRLLLQRGLVQTQLFTDVESALRDADAALRLAASVAPDNRALAGEIRTLKGRALLNLGRFAEARRELREAMRLLGNLTTRVDRADLIARSDLAVAALLAGDPEDARRYLAYTGAGHFNRGFFRPLGIPRPPRCGPAIAPEDVAVVEAIVNVDGSVADAKPIYVSRQGPAATEFARAVRRWRFDAENVRNIPALFRTVVRLEIRCSQAAARTRYVENDAALDRLAAADPAWARAISSRAGRTEVALRAELAALDAQASPPPREILPLLLLVADRSQGDDAGDAPLLVRALSSAAALDAPPPVLASIALALAEARTPPARPGRRPDPLDFAALLAMPEIARSPEAAALVRLAQARSLYRRGEQEQALALARQVRALPEASGGGIGAEALEVEVAVHGARGRTAEAQAAYQAIGPDAARCGLPPSARPVSTDGRDFPNDALRWGFEGWAVNELSIAPDGRVAGSRTVAAYPPFVFADASRPVSERARYDRTFVPDGAACVSDASRVVFRLPDRAGD